jgi:DNA polymerase-3 subunit delta
MALKKPEEFYAQLKKKTLAPVYLFAGEEAYLLDEAVDYLERALAVDSLNREVFHAGETPVATVVLAAQTMPFMGDKRLVIMKDVQRLKAAETEGLCAFLKHPSESTCLLLLWQDKLKSEDRRKALVTAADNVGMAVEFRALYDRELPGWVQQMVLRRGKKISMDAAQYLVEESGGNLLDLTNEIEKLSLYTGGRSDIAIKDVEAISGHTRQTNLNHLAEAVETRNAAEALLLAGHLLREGEVAIRLLATVYRVIRRLTVAKGLLEQKKSSHQDIRQELRLHQYFDRNFFSNLSRYGLKELEGGIERIAAADLALKTSSRPEAMIIEELLSGLCRKRADQLR